MCKMFFSQKNQHKHRSINMEELISHAKKEFDNILSYVQGKAQENQIHEVERSIFFYLMQMGLTLLLIFLKQKGLGWKGKTLTDKKENKRFFHSIKPREYLSIFGKITITRSCYWKKGYGEVYPLDAELNLPKTEHSYLLQEWTTALGAEEPYEKAAKFLGTMLGVPLWGSTTETMMKEACIDVPDFYKERELTNTALEKEILVATVDGKGVVMRKDQIQQKIVKKRLKKMRKLEEKKPKELKKEKEKKLGKKKVSTVIGVYTIDPYQREAEDFLRKGKTKEEKPIRPRPTNKIIQATLEGKEEAFKRLQIEVEKRDPLKEKKAAALVDGEHKLRELMKKYLPWFLIIIDIYHVMEYLWKGARVFHREGSVEEEKWASERLEKLLKGKVSDVICELKELLKPLSKGRKKSLQKIITYLENGKGHMQYDLYLKKGYPIGSGVVEGACKNLVKDRMEQCGMRWTIAGAEAALGMRSIQINGMSKAYWEYHVSQEKERLYGAFIENNTMSLAA